MFREIISGVRGLEHRIDAVYGRARVRSLSPTPIVRIRFAHQPTTMDLFKLTTIAKLRGFELIANDDPTMVVFESSVETIKDAQHALLQILEDFLLLLVQSTPPGERPGRFVARLTCSSQASQRKSLTAAADDRLSFCTIRVESDLLNR